MRKMLLTLLCMLPMALYSQGEYRGMVAEGKAWLIYHYTMLEEYRYSYKMFLKGDTVIDGVAYKKLYSEMEKEVPVYAGAFREDGMKVYFRYTEQWGSKEVCLYDFGLDVGDTFTAQDGEGKLTVVSKKYEEHFGQKRLTLSVRSGEDSSLATEWIEGIGSNSRPNCNEMLAGNYDRLVVCAEAKDTIFVDAKRYIPTGVTPVAKQAAGGDGAIYDVAGRRLNGAPAKGMYIKNRKIRINGLTD